MAIIRVSEIWQGRGGSGSFEETQHTRVFLVITNNKFDTEVEATFSGTPKLGDLHPSDGNSFCQNVSAEQESFSPTVWIVTCSYSSKNERKQDPDNPLNDEAKITWTTESFQREAVLDRNDDGVLNSAGDMFNPSVTIDDSRITVNIQTNHASVPSWILDTRDALNSTAVTIDGLSIGMEVAKIKSVVVSENKVRNDIPYRTVTLVINLNKDGWQPRVLDRGFRRIETDEEFEARWPLPNPGGAGNKKRVHIVNADGTAVVGPTLLDGYGALLEDPSPAKAVFLKFLCYETFNFNNLPLS